MAFDAMTKSQLEALDEGQRRMMSAAETLFKIPEVHARVHEYDDLCQETERKCL